MLVPLEALAAYYGEHEAKLRTILRARVEAPAEFRVSTEHFASTAMVFPYIYHAALVEKTLAGAGSSSPRILD